MEHKEYYMERCLALARMAEGCTSPNPMVGAVIVARGRIIGEGYHHRCGEPHAEVNAIASVAAEDVPLLKESTIYVSLEPCSHYGKTPPCANLIIEKQIPRVVVGVLDPFPEVAGRGVKRLRDAGIEVEVGVCAAQCDELNRRFFTFHRLRRPYVLLKWAQSADGFIGREGERVQLSTELTAERVHALRGVEDAILVGTNTALTDNPRLTCRMAGGKNPIRMVVDRELRLPQTLHLFDGEAPTVLFTASGAAPCAGVEAVRVDDWAQLLPSIMRYCYEHKIQSLIVEGGAMLLQSFLECDLYDELRVEVAPWQMHEGVRAPEIDLSKCDCTMLDGHQLYSYRHRHA